MRLVAALVAIGCLGPSAAATAWAAQAAPVTVPVQGSAAADSAAAGGALPAETPVAANGTGEGVAPALEPETDVTIDRRTGFAAAVGYGGPLGASATLTLLRGLGADVREGGERVKAVCAAPIRHCANGFLVETAAGHRGGRFSVGLGGRVKVDDEDFRGTIGLGVKVSAVRTWNARAGEDPDRTWLGPELDLVVKRVGVGVGLLWPVSGARSATPRFSWTVGLVL